MKSHISEKFEDGEGVEVNAEYPTDEQLEAIRNWPIEEGCIPRLFAAVREAWSEYGSVSQAPAEYVEGVVPFLKDPEYWALVTGGWSGNEDVIGALSDNAVLWSVMWVSSHRGGLHILEVGEFCDDQSGAFQECVPKRELGNENANHGRDARAPLVGEFSSDAERNGAPR